MTIHKCNKEKEILEMHSDIAAIKEQNKNQNDLIKDIHKVLVGNGKPGLVNEFNQWKGASRALQWIFGTVIALLSIVIAFRWK